MDPRAQQWALGGARALVAQLPRLVGGALLGAVTSSLGFAAVGLVLAGAARLWWSHSELEAPGWLGLSLGLTPVVLGLAGLYVGAVRGVLRALARALVEGRLVGHLYAVVKPGVVKALKALRGGAAPTAQEVAEVVRRSLEQAPQLLEPPRGFGDRLASFLAGRSRRLVLLLVAGHVAHAKDGAEAVRSLETFGLQQLQATLLGSLEDLFALKLTVVMAVAFLLCVAPQVAFVLWR